MTAIGAFLKTFIYLISASLLYPVLLLLSVLCLYIIVCGGTFFAEWLERTRLHKCPPQDLPDLLANGDPSAVVAHRVNRYIKTLLQVMRRNDGVDAAVENLLQQETLMLWKSIDRLWLLVRVAPALGLLGTLIPMGTGLAALGQGDMTQLSADLVVAFTTTVAGLAVGTAAVVMYTVRRRWIEEDVKNMELATELLTLRTERDKHALFEKTANEAHR
ncbi:MotA/TolQ/ExbB proton channel family protein [Desulfoglaeba alkanexedens]|uniref:Biopolymer transporter n=1 Tax=Desulfoglaeba alkanexedens ALDC TaxID=980445 RepID=A0A4P8L5H8_9BACT|nr:MotA/TolQ/ExbB proton channel family protein [Desulfoglaeba alkanexedens]QCQ23170.1 biopolymer transporter [Desulfoglaeba alkanexedens ALDC]